MERKIDRLDRFARYKGINDNQLTKQSGIAVGTLGKSRKPGKDMSGRTCRSILEAFPELSQAWLMEGKGEMLSTDLPHYPDGIVFIDDVTAECGALTGTLDSTQYAQFPHVSLPGIPKDTEFFIRASGYSMINEERPEFSIPPGALVGVSRLKSGNISWGETYVMATPAGIMVKRVFPSDDKNKIRCVSYNSKDYPEFSVDREDILEVGRITCVVPVYIR